MTVNINNLESVLLTNQLSSLSDDDILYYSKIINQLKIGTVFTVASYSNLPDVKSVEIGSIYLVENEGIVYIPNKKAEMWIKISQDITGLIWGLGNNLYGKLGNNSTVQTDSPVSVIGANNSWSQISQTVLGIAALQDDGTIWAWGDNALGEMGNGTTVRQSSPVSVVGGFTDWTQLPISAGLGSHQLALRSNKTIWSWGFNGQGQLGDNSTTVRSSPVSIVGGIDNWLQISTGVHSSAIREDGTLWTWGDNDNGQLGDGTTVDRSSPVSVVGGFTNWCQISIGGNLTSAIRADGTLWAWGDNSSGQLGNGATVKRSSPVSVVGGFTDWCHIRSSLYLSAAIRSNGTIWTWGKNDLGQLGDNSTTNRLSPVQVVGGYTDWCDLAAGPTRMAAIRTNGTLWAWGCNISGSLGDGTFISRSSPVSIVGGFTDWWKITANCCNTIGIRLIS